LQPRFRRAAEGFAQAESYFRADAGLAVDKVVDRLTGTEVREFAQPAD
jgi:hypothetical protein